MTIFPKLSFRQRLIMGTMLFITILMIIGNVIFANNLLNSRQHEIKTEMDAMAKVFANAVKDALISSDIAVIKEFAENVASTASIAYVSVSDADKQVLYKTQKTPEKIEFTDELAVNKQEFFNYPIAITVDDSYFGEVIIGLDVQQIRKSINSLENYLYLSTVILLVVMMIGLQIFLGLMTTRLTKLRNTFRGLIDGDSGLDVSIPLTGPNDELYEIAQCFNQFVGQLKHLILDILAVSKELSGSSHHVQKLALETSDAMEQQVKSISEFSNDVSDMAQYSQGVNQDTIEVSQHSDSMEQEADNGRVVVQAALDEINQLVQNSNKVSESVKQLAADTNEIVRVIDLIKEIADQTNLLALNAAIEAARAGENGRGFAVVADEVRNLSLRTSQATSEIYDMIQTIKAGSDKAVTVMDKNVSDVELSQEKVQQADAAFDSIAQTIYKVRDVGSQSREKSEQQHQLVVHIQNTVQQITKDVQEMAEMSRKNTSDSADLSQYSTKLEELASSFSK